MDGRVSVRSAETWDFWVWSERKRGANVRSRRRDESEEAKKKRDETNLQRSSQGREFPFESLQASMDFFSLDCRSSHELVLDPVRSARRRTKKVSSPVHLPLPTPPDHLNNKEQTLRDSLSNPIPNPFAPLLLTLQQQHPALVQILHPLPNLRLERSHPVRSQLDLNVAQKVPQFLTLNDPGALVGRLVGGELGGEGSDERIGFGELGGEEGLTTGEEGGEKL